MTLSVFRRFGPAYTASRGGANSRIDIRAIQSTAGMGSNSSAFAGSASKTCRRNATSSRNVHCAAFIAGLSWVMECCGKFHAPTVLARARVFPEVS